MRALDAIGNREAFGLNWDPSHMMWQDLDPVAFITDFADRIYHVDCKDTRMRLGGGRNGVLSSHLPWGDPRRGWDFVSVGRGDVPWEDCFRALRAIGYDGPISVEWEDAGMDRLHGAPEALEYLKRFDFEPPTASFDAAFSSPAAGRGGPRSRHGPVPGGYVVTGRRSLRDLLNQRAGSPTVGAWACGTPSSRATTSTCSRSLAGRETVDLVYIDPPYNTGNAFAYRDDYRATATGWTMMRPRLRGGARGAGRDRRASSSASTTTSRPGCGC